MSGKHNFASKNKSGQAAMTAVIFFIFISLVLAAAFAGFAAAELQSAKTLEKSKQSFIFAEGALEDAIFRVISGKNMPGQVVYAENGVKATTTLNDVSGSKEIETIGENNANLRKIKAVLEASAGASFYYGLQTGNGGFFMENTSRVTGNIYSNGQIEGQNSNLIAGDAVSAGANGLIDGIHATGTAYAHAIRDSDIDGDAYYQIIENTDVGGVEFPGSEDQPELALPISDETIDLWKQSAQDGGTINCSDKYEIKDDIVLGPAKITCDLEISGDPLVTIGGMVWVEGNINIKNSAIIKLSSSLGQKSVAVIADNPADRTNSSAVIIQNSVEFQNSGTEGSYVMLISQNSSAESGGDKIAIDFKNTAFGDVLLYAARGEILMQNNNSLREITAFKVHLKNAAHVIYETGLANLIFESGPSGGWQIANWQEIP